MKKNTDTSNNCIFLLEKYSRRKEEKDIYQQKLNALESWFGKISKRAPHNVKQRVHTGEIVGRIESFPRTRGNGSPYMRKVANPKIKSRKESMKQGDGMI